MNLMDVIEQMESFSDDATIYAVKPWHPAALAIVAMEPEQGGLPDAVRNEGALYFIEVEIAREFLADIEQFQRGVGISLEQKANRLIQYALNDA